MMICIDRTVCCAAMALACQFLVTGDSIGIRAPLASEVVPTVVADRPVAAPATLDELQTRLEKLFGAFDPKHLRHVRIPFDEKTERKHDATKPLTHVTTSRGRELIGAPYRWGRTVAFEVDWEFERETYDVDDAGAQTRHHFGDSHSTLRYVLRLAESGDVSFHADFLTHGDPSLAGSTQWRGTVVWHTDGFELIGTTPAVEVVVPGGKRTLSAGVHRRRFIQTGNEIRVRNRSRRYAPARDDEGNVLPIPDLKQPLEPEQFFERKGEALDAGDETPETPP